MPSNHLHAESTPGEVLSHVAEFSGLAGKFARVGKARDLYRRVQRSPEGFRLETLLAEMRIGLTVGAADEARVPASGPVVVVANHPYGVLDGAILTVLLTRVRPDVKVLTNFLLSDIPELQKHCIFVDPFQTDRSLESNRRGLREALAWLQKGSVLAIFPAGEVSQWQMPAAQIVDPEWNDTAVRLIRKTGATVLPVYLCGHNGVGFQLMGMIHPKLRSAFLLQEFLTQAGKTVEVRVGSGIPADAVEAIADDHEATQYLHWRTYLLGRRSRREASWPDVLRSKFVFKIQEPVAAAVASDLLAKELEALPKDRRLAANTDFVVYLGAAREIPQLLQEVGRLREVTFRGAGEGTGKSRDLDSFDDYYSHILLWHKTRQELVGAYRAGNTAEILAEHGIGGLYTSTLFRYDEKIFQKLGPALELGRSFIRPEYQRQYAPLLLLWKGIGTWVARHPRYSVLIGAVSVSNQYSPASRELIARYFEKQGASEECRGAVKARRPLRGNLVQKWETAALCSLLPDMEDLSAPIADLEPDGKGIPILVKQYVKLGGKLLAFSVDPQFANTLDGFVMVDLTRTSPEILARYMGREQAQSFFAWHRTPHPRAA